MLAKLYGLMARVSMLLEDKPGWQEGIDQVQGTLETIFRYIISPVIAVVAALGAVYAIFIGVKMARADNAEQRDEMKKKLIWIVIGVVVMIALIILFNLLPSLVKTILISYYPEMA